MMKQAAKRGNDLNLQATPSFVVLTQAFVGDPGLEAPVSYTHLDVYKRQHIALLLKE